MPRALHDDKFAPLSCRKKLFPCGFSVNPFYFRSNPHFFSYRSFYGTAGSLLGASEVPRWPLGWCISQKNHPLLFIVEWLALSSFISLILLNTRNLRKLLSVSSIIGPIRWGKLKFGSLADLNFWDIEISCPFNCPPRFPRWFLMRSERIQKNESVTQARLGSWCRKHYSKSPSTCIRRHCLYVFTKPRGDYSFPLNSPRSTSVKSSHAMKIKQNKIK
jgi:hypothetical protein